MRLVFSTFKIVHIINTTYCEQFTTSKAWMFVRPFQARHEIYDFVQN